MVLVMAPRYKGMIKEKQTYPSRFFPKMCCMFQLIIIINYVTRKYVTCFLLIISINYVTCFR